MKLVVCYTHGDYDGMIDENRCIEYESKEKFLVDFEKAFKSLIHYEIKRNELMNRLAMARGTRDKIKIQPVWEEWLEFCREGYIGLDRINVGEYQICEFEDYDLETYEILKMPEVYTLEEWFEGNHFY